MPKPFSHLTGNGCHSHISLWNLNGTQNLFDGSDDSRDLGLSPLAYQFLGGIMHSADCLAAIFNPAINSYKRINAPRTLSGATWSSDVLVDSVTLYTCGGVFDKATGEYPRRTVVRAERVID